MMLLLAKSHQQSHCLSFDVAIKAVIFIMILLLYIAIRLIRTVICKY